MKVARSRNVNLQLRVVRNRAPQEPIFHPSPHVTTHVGVMRILGFPAKLDLGHVAETELSEPMVQPGSHSTAIQEHHGDPLTAKPLRKQQRQLRNEQCEVTRLLAGYFLGSQRACVY